MEDGFVQTYGHGGGTNLLPLTVFILFIACILIFSLKGKKCLVPFLIITLLIPYGQVLVIGGVHFLVSRILLLLLVIKAFVFERSNTITLNKMDKVIIWWVIVSVIAYTLLWKTVGAFVSRMSFAVDVLSVYFVFRAYIKDMNDFDIIIKTQIFLAIIIAIFMVFEQTTGRNFLSIFGGVPENTVIRNGKLRSQAAFAHAILAGSFGATFFPILISMWWSERPNKFLIFAGAIALIIIILTSASSGPIMSLLIGIIGLCLWPLRYQMSKIRWGMVLTLIGLQIIMKAPVWALISRIDLVGGSTGYHRYQMIDNFIRRFGEWWLFGLQSTKHWGWMMDDTSEEYIATGIRGGVFSFVLFITIFVICFKISGRIIVKHRDNPKIQHKAWALGTAVLAHLVAFLGIAYFDQSALLLYSLFAVISSFSDFYLNEPTEANTAFTSPLNIPPTG